MIGFARVFWWAFILWLLGRLFLKVRFGYPKALEVAGLGLMISVLGASRDAAADGEPAQPVCHAEPGVRGQRL